MYKKYVVFNFIFVSIVFCESYVSLQPIISDYSLGIIYSAELNETNSNIQIVNSFGLGTGLSYGNLYNAVCSKLKFDYYFYKSIILKDSVDSRDYGKIVSLSVGSDFLSKIGVSIYLGAGPAIIYYNKTFIYKYKNSEVTLLKKFYLGFFADFFISYGVKFKVGLGISYYYWNSDNFIFGLDENLKPIPLQGKQRRHYVRPYLRIQIGQ